MTTKNFTTVHATDFRLGCVNSMGGELMVTLSKHTQYGVEDLYNCYLHKLLDSEDINILQGVVDSLDQLSYELDNKRECLIHEKFKWEDGTATEEIF